MEGFLSGCIIGSFPTHTEFPLLGGLNKSRFGFGKTLVTIFQSVGNWLYKFGTTAASIKYPDKKVDDVLGAMMRTQTLRELDIPSEEVIRRRNRDMLTMVVTIGSLAVTTNSAGNTKKIPKTYLKTDEDRNKDKTYSNVGTTDVVHPRFHPKFVYIRFTFLTLFTSNFRLHPFHIWDHLHLIHVYLRIIFCSVYI